jgi:hypothetical protein
VNDSWESARQHPTLSVVRLFAAGLVGVGMISYFGPGEYEFYPSLVTGLGCGLVLALLGWREIHGDAAALKRPLRRLTVFNALTVGVGIAVLACGASIGDWSLALSGLPLLALGAGLTAARHLVNRRMRTE